MSKQAKFITLEGGEGSGKSTLLTRIQNHFRKQGAPYIVSREPGGTPVAEKIREVILAHAPAGEPPMEGLTELLLYEAARSEHVTKVIRPALKAGKHVLCDRFTTSSLAYQGMARGLGLKLVHDLNTIATGGLEPDLILWLKLSPEEGKRRTASRGGENRLDQEKAAFHQKIYEAFENLAEESPNRFLVLDASKSPEQVFEQLLSSSLWKKAFPEHAK